MAAPVSGIDSRLSQTAVTGYVAAVAAFLTHNRVMPVFTFDATVSAHDLLKAGVTEAKMPGSQHRHHRVVVAAEDRDTAALIAAQMVSSFGICTGLYDRV